MFVTVGKGVLFMTHPLLRWGVQVNSIASAQMALVSAR